MKVYIATSGSYSDYRIDSVFSKMETAEEYVAQNPRYDADITDNDSGVRNRTLQ